MPASQPVSLPASQPASPPVCLPACLPVCLSVCLSACLSCLLPLGLHSRAGTAGHPRGISRPAPAGYQPVRTRGVSAGPLAFSPAGYQPARSPSHPRGISRPTRLLTRGVPPAFPPARNCSLIGSRPPAAHPHASAETRRMPACSGAVVCRGRVPACSGAVVCRGRVPALRGRPSVRPPACKPVARGCTRTHARQYASKLAFVASCALAGVCARVLVVRAR
jgi:hypothetical protein